MTIFLYSLILTGSISFLAVLLIPDGKRVKTQVVDNGADTRVGAERGQAVALEVDYLRPADATHAADWGYLMNRSADDQVTPTQQVLVIDRRTQHVERDDGGYRDNLINGLVNYLSGPSWLKVAMECFVVVTGFLILAGAVNTSILGQQRRAEPAGRGRRADALVPAAAQAVRQQLPHHPHGRLPAIGRHPVQPGAT